MYGEWWVEDRENLSGDSYEPPEHRVAGYLEATGPSNWTLETIGSVEGRSLQEHLSAQRSGGSNGPVHIWGVNAQGKAFSLLNCYPWQTTVRFGISGEGSQVWRMGAIVEASGAWVTPDEEIDHLSISYRDLAEWAWDRSDRVTDWDFQDDGIELTVSLVPRSIDASVRGHPVELSWGLTAPLKSGSFPVDTQAALSISDRLELSEIAEAWLYPLGRLLSLLTLTETHITSINARLADSEQDGYWRHVNIRLPQRIRSEPGDREDRDPLARQLDFMATRADLQEHGLDLEALLQAHIALEATPTLRDTLTHLLDSQNKDGDEGPDEALRCLLNAVENYHSARFDGAVQDEPDLAAEIDRIVKQSVQQHRNVIAWRLKGSNRKPFRAKLEELVQSCGEAADRVLYNHPDLVEHALQARNQLAHTNPTTSSRWLRQIVLRNLRWLMRHALLRELGLTVGEADAVFRLMGRPFSQYAGHVGG